MEEYLKIFEQLKKSLEPNTRDLVDTYLDNIEDLDDCIFVSVLDELAEYKVNINKFDQILNKGEWTESEMIYLEYMINFVNSLIREHIRNKVEELNNMLKRFQ